MVWVNIQDCDTHLQFTLGYRDYHNLDVYVQLSAPNPSNWKPHFWLGEETTPFKLNLG